MQLQTIGGISRTTGYLSHQVRYVVRTRAIEEALRLGEHGAQIFDQPSVTRIIQELDIILVRRIPFASARKKNGGRRELV